MRASLQPVQDRDVYAEFDLAFGVRDWTSPGARRTIITQATDPNRDPDAPAWWHGDEEASQGFLAAAGIKLT